MKNYSQYLSNQEKKIDEMIHNIKESLAKAPEGGLRIIHNHGSSQYYIRKNDGETGWKYIKKQDISLAKGLAQREYDRKLLKILEKDKNKIQHSWNGTEEEELKRAYEELSDDRKKLVTPRILSDEEFVRQWKSREYKGKYISDEIPEIYTEKGERVRSKSEKLIADKLLMMEIPYRYEYPLVLKNIGKIYPDFLLLNVAERKEILFEHFGMMDNKEYCEKAIKKINAYEKCGIFPGDRLILTYETSKNPIDMRLVEKILEKFCI